MAKYKGISYVTKALRKYAGKKYSTHKKASKKARAIVKQFKKKKEKVTVKKILSFAAPKPAPKKKKVAPRKKPISRKKVVSKKKASTKKKAVSKKKAITAKPKPKKGAPVLDPQLIELTHYFHLQNYPLLIQQMPEEPPLYFKSKIIPEGLADLYAGFEYDYNEYFAPFVNFINSIKHDSPEGTYENEWFVRCTEPKWDRALKTWVSRIISCDSNGVEFDYGFDGKEPAISQPTPVQPKPITPKAKEPAAPEKPKEAPPVADKQALEIEKERTKQKEAEAKIAQAQVEKSKVVMEAMKMLKDKTITPSQFDDIIRSLA